MAGGFMAGFGSGFANSFENAQNRKATKEQDAFRIAYDSWTKKTAEYDTAKSKDQAAVKKAIAFVEANNLPAGAVGNIVGWVRADMSDEWIDKKIKTTKFDQTPQTPDAPQPSQAADQPMDLQMQGSGLSPPTPASSQNAPNTNGPVDQQQQPAAEQPGLLQQVGDKIMGAFDPAKKQQGMIDGANKKVMSQTGTSQEKFNAVNAGYKPVEYNGVPSTGTAGPTASTAAEGDPNKAIFAKVGGVWKAMMPTGGGNGIEFGSDKPINAKDVDTYMTKDQYQNMETAGQTIGKDAKDLLDSKNTTLGLVSEIKDLSDMATTNGIVLTKSSAVSTVFNEVKNEIGGMLQQVNTGDMDIKEVEAQYEAKITEGLVNANVNAEAAQLFAAKATMVQFKLARLLNGAGAMTQKDFDQAGKTLFNTNDQGIFASTAKELAQTLTANYDQAALTMMNTPNAKNAAANNVPVDELFAPLSNSIQDSNLKAWLEPAADDTSGKPQGAGAPQQVKPDAPVEQKPVAEGVVDTDFINQHGLDDTDLNKPYRVIIKDGKKFLEILDGPTGSATQ